MTTTVHIPPHIHLADLVGFARTQGCRVVHQADGSLRMVPEARNVVPFARRITPPGPAGGEPPKGAA